MRKIDGFQVLAAAKKLNSETAVIILTGHSDVNLTIDALRLGGYDYALKPCEHEELIFRMTNCLKKLEAKRELKKAEEQIKSSLKEKEILLKEIHHRVKNNMAVISSLLKLQMSNVDNQTAKEALQDSQNRVKAMSMIHETLYRSDNLATIKFNIET